MSYEGAPAHFIELTFRQPAYGEEGPRAFAEKRKPEFRRE